MIIIVIVSGWGSFSGDKFFIVIGSGGGAGVEEVVVVGESGTWQG